MLLALLEVNESGNLMGPMCMCMCVLYICCVNIYIAVLMQEFIIYPMEVELHRKSFMLQSSGIGSRKLHTHSLRCK